MNRNFAQRAQLRKIGIIVLLIGLVVGLTACVTLWQAPVADLQTVLPWPHRPHPRMFEVPLTVIFDISASRGIDQEIVSFELDFGDGTVHKGTDLASPIEHTYTEAGFFRAVLTVTDAAGKTGRSRPIRIDTLPVHVYYSVGGRIHRVRVHDSHIEIVGGVVGKTNLFPSLVLNTRDRITFTANAPAGDWNIWMMLTEVGRWRSQLTDHADNEIQPTWSHDGDKIAYARHHYVTGLWEIWTMLAHGADEAMLITQTPSDVWAPAFSPKNDDLVFVKEVGGTSQLWIRRVGDVDPALLHSVAGVRVGDPSPATVVISPALGLPAGAGISQPRWSPDGTKIVFARQRTADHPTIIDIHVLVVGALTSKSLAAYVIGDYDITTIANEFSPHWLEDGNIAFIRETTPGVFQLFHVDLTTGALRYLTEPGAAIMPAQR